MRNLCLCAYFAITKCLRMEFSKEQVQLACTSEDSRALFHFFFLALERASHLQKCDLVGARFLCLFAGKLNQSCEICINILRKWYSQNLSTYCYNPSL